MAVITVPLHDSPPITLTPLVEVPPEEVSPTHPEQEDVTLEGGAEGNVALELVGDEGAA